MVPVNVGQYYSPRTNAYDTQYIHWERVGGNYQSSCDNIFVLETHSPSARRWNLGHGIALGQRYQ